MSCLVFYVHSGGTRRVKNAVLAEIREAIHRAAQESWDTLASQPAILGSVEEEMIAR